jgi:DNA-binding protein H-NS
MSGHKDGNTVAVDLDRMSVQQLAALIEAAEAKRRDKLEEAKATLRAEVERKAAELGISAGDLFAQAGQRVPTEQRTRGRRSRGGVAGAKLAAKYRDPETGETWSGRGRPPRWLAAREAEGRDRKEFAVEPELRLP